MDYFVQFQLNVFALLCLAVLYVIMRTKSKVESFGKRLLRMIMAATAAAVILEPLTWIFDRKLFFGAYLLEYWTNFGLFLIGPVLGGLMLSYVDYHLFKAPSRVYKKLFYQHMTIFTFVVLLINVFYPVYFDVDPVVNGFSSGPLKEFHYLILAGIYISMFRLLIKNKPRVSRSTYWIFTVFFALPIAGMVVQLFDSKLYFSWTSIVLGILVAYTFLESTTSEQDFLTKLYNRQSYEIYLNHMIEIRRPFGIILIDLDHFKEINDHFGHQQGDQVLLEFARVLEKTFKNHGLPARIGGDEFVIVLHDEGRPVRDYVKEMSARLKTYEDPFIRNLQFSYGWSCYEEGMSMEELYTSADQKMYKDKREGRLM
ncbi:GGDEF domain-containing protein [Halobacillus kuroshimensis]|uniref:GGDEF domain-containing protein n=1 Tax=Halobacillus kuroshimensis TaxID=302481 RepID=UPI0003FCE941|nr:GGDEF domain-containing protein [Halobacillus kuroshimensis]